MAGIRKQRLMPTFITPDADARAEVAMSRLRFGGAAFGTDDAHQVFEAHALRSKNAAAQCR